MDTTKLLALWKYAISFRKRTWELSDYPIRVRRMEVPNDATSNARIAWHSWIAQVVNWWTLSGGGNTPTEAMTALQVAFESQKQRRDRMPRPGTAVPIEMAATHRIEEHPALARDFFRRILDMDLDECFISDQSSLSDFHCEETDDHLQEAILLAYGVDVSDIDGGNLAEIFERLVSRGVAV